MVELGEHCHTHIIPRLKKVIDGEDKGGITEAVGWKGGGGFRYYRLAPSLLEKDQFGNWVMSKQYNAAMLAEAMCKLEGFTYAPSDTVYWQHGHSTETDFIYVTTQTLTREQLQKLSDEVGESRSLLVMCGAFRVKNLDDFPNLNVKKIPKAVLNRCEWGHDDYSLEIKNLPMKAPEEETREALPQRGSRAPRLSGESAFNALYSIRPLAEEARSEVEKQEPALSSDSGDPRSGPRRPPHDQSTPRKWLPTGLSGGRSSRRSRRDNGKPGMVKRCLKDWPGCSQRISARVTPKPTCAGSASSILNTSPCCRARFITHCVTNLRRTHRYAILRFITQLRDKSIPDSAWPVILQMPQVRSWKPGRLHPNLSWTHYRTLLRVDKPEARAFYEIEAIKNNWAAREMERQINSLLYERLALSRDKKGLMRLALKGHEVQTARRRFQRPGGDGVSGLPESPSWSEPTWSRR